MAGHKGMVGSAILRSLEAEGCNQEVVTSSRQSLDLTNQSDVRKFFANEEIDQVYLAAAKVGGIFANWTFPAQFIYDNLMIQANVIEAAYRSGVKKLLFLGSSCIYPKIAEQPLTEEALLTGPLEPTNEPYAIAKIAGIKLCESYSREYGVDYRSVMPTNLYGPGDNYHTENSHVIPALIRKFHEAKIRSEAKVKVWGTGTPKREFLYVDDMARACIHVMKLDKSLYDKHTEPMRGHINVGSGEETTIRELALLIRSIVGYGGEIEFDLSKPDGISRKLMDSQRLNSLGWQSEIRLKEGLELTYDEFVSCLK